MGSCTAVLGFLIVFFGTVLSSLNTGDMSEQFFEGMTVGPCLLAAGIFIVVVSMHQERFERHRRLWSYGAEASFCIYLVHVFFLKLFRLWGFDEMILHPLLSVPLLSAAVLAASLAVYFLLSRVPVARRWLM